MPESDRTQCIGRLRKVTIVCTLCIFSIMVFAEVILGYVYENDCPRQPFIPIFFCGFFVIFIVPCQACFEKFFIVIFLLASAFVLGWFIAGNVMIYSIYEPNYNKNTTNVDLYCNKTLYLFAFWGVNLTYVLLGVLIFSICCCKKQERDEEAQK